MIIITMMCLTMPAPPLLLPADRPRDPRDPPLPTDALQDRAQPARHRLPVRPEPAPQRRQPVPDVPGAGAPALNADPRQRAPPRHRHFLRLVVEFFLLTAAADGRGDLGEPMRSAPLQPHSRPGGE